MKRIVSLILTAALCAASVFSLVGCAGGDKIESGMGEIWDGVKEGAGEAVEDLITPTSFEMINSDRVSLALLDDAAAPSEAVMTATLTATVKPEEATDKSVDWSVYWINNAEGDEALVSDYLTINPTAEGSTTATVTVHQPFAGSTIGIKVTTRIGGYSAECRATYIGMPNAAEILVPDELKDDMGRIFLAPKSEYAFDISLTNIFGEVTEEYLAEHADLSCTVTGIGSFIAHVVVGGSVPEYDKEVPLEADKDRFIEASIVDGKLVVIVKQAVEGCSFTLESSGVDISYVSGGENCYFILSVVDSASGLVATVNVRILVTANGVELSTGELVF